MASSPARATGFVPLGACRRAFFRALVVAATGLSGASGPGVSGLHAETVVQGELSGGEWTEAASPYHAAADIELPAGTALAIQAGVELRLDPGVSIVIRGSLDVLGTEEKPVRWVRADASRPWGGAAFRGASSAGTLDHLELAGPSRVAGEDRIAFKIDGKARVTLRKCWFHDFPEVAIDSSGGSELVVQDSLVENSMEAIHTARSYALIEGTTVRNVTGYSDSIDFDYETTPRSVIRNCIIENNEDDDGIDLQGSSALIENTIIRGVKAGKAISIDLVSTPTIRGVLVYDCLWGLVVKDSTTAQFQQCTVTRCDVGVKVYNKVSGAGGGHMTADSLIVWGNRSAIEVDALSSLELTYSLVAGGYAGVGNIDLDPRFVDPAAADFRLLPGSPAIGTGKDSVDMGAMPPVEVPPITFIRGDANGDRSLDIADAVTIILYLFNKGATPICLDALDADDALSIEITDAIYVLSLLFLGGPAPPAPFPDPGTDPTTGDPVSCAGGAS